MSYPLFQIEKVFQFEFSTIFSSKSYTRSFLKLRRYCRGVMAAQNRSSVMLRHLKSKSRDPSVAPCTLLPIAQNVMRHCKYSL